MSTEPDTADITQQKIYRGTFAFPFQHSLPPPLTQTNVENRRTHDLSEGETLIGWWIPGDIL